MKYNCECTVSADLYQEISRLNALIFEKSFDCEMFKIKLEVAEESAERWKRRYFDAIGPQSEYTNDLMRC